MDFGLDEFDASGDDLEPSTSDCFGTLGPVPEVKVTAIGGGQIEMPNAWDAMLQWYEVSPFDPLTAKPGCTVPQPLNV